MQDAHPAVGGTSSPPNTYGAGGRAIKTVKDAAGVERHTVDVFGTLRLAGATYDAGTNDYERTATTEKVFLSGLGRVVYDGAHALPSPSQSELHVFLAIGDHQGSTSVVIDLETSEVVEKATYLAFGAPDSDFRPERWGAHREDNRYTGKEDDIEVGLTYFGARYYSPYLHSWTQADPLSPCRPSGATSIRTRSSTETLHRTRIRPASTAAWTTSTAAAAVVAAVAAAAAVGRPPARRGAARGTTR